MLLPVGENLPEAREELNPGPFSQRRRDVTKLNQSVQQRPRLRRAQTKDRCVEKKKKINVKYFLATENTVTSIQLRITEDSKYMAFLNRAHKLPLVHF